MGGKIKNKEEVKIVQGDPPVLKKEGWGVENMPYPTGVALIAIRQTPGYAGGLPEFDIFGNIVFVI